MQSALYNFQMANANKLASRCLSQKNKRARGSKREGGRGGGLSQMFEDYYEGE